jgi:MFS family permease
VAVPILALLAALSLADASVVTLALPPILRELDTTIEGVAAVIGVYTLVLAPGVLLGDRVAGRRGAASAGAVVFAAGSLGSGLAGSLAVLLVFRAVQAVGASLLLPAAFRRLDGAGAGRRLWLGATVFGTAVGPTLGGILTQALDWRAIFLVQAPVAAVGAVAALPRRGRARFAGADPPVLAAPVRERMSLRRGLALGALAASLTAVLFLLVLLLVAGWSFSPLGAALTVSVLPVAAIAAHAVAPQAVWRAPVGCGLVAAGTLCLAFLPTASAAWTIAPQVLAGIGMGLALPALAGHDDPPALSVRHTGITLALLVLGPVVAHQLDSATERAKERGVALVLQSDLDPVKKLKVGPALVDGVDAQDPRDGLQRAVAAQVAEAGDDAADVAELGRRADETLIRGVGEAFRIAFLVTGGLALAAGLVAAPWGRIRPALVAAGAAAALVVPAAYGGLFALVAPAPPAIPDPCHPPPAPDAGGITGLLQSGALSLLDRAACHVGSSREELVLALADDAERDRFEARYGIDPRSLSGALSALF